MPVHLGSIRRVLYGGRSGIAHVLMGKGISFEEYLSAGRPRVLEWESTERLSAEQRGERKCL
jgi:hypothetical protein